MNILMVSGGYFPERVGGSYRYLSSLSTDILVHTSSQPEPFGLVLLEGMVMGKPNVATDAGGVPEIIVNGVTGILVKPADSSAITEAVIYLLSNTEEAKEIGNEE